MILDFCVACGEKEPTKLENHHLVPRSAGGSDEPANLITLCFDCHGKAHGYQRRDIRKLVKAGLAAAKANGKKLGNPKLHDRDPATIQKLTASRKARYLNEIKPTANMWLPIVKRMRPNLTWDAVSAAVTEQTGQQWNEDRLRRAVKLFVAEGLADPALLKKAPQSRTRIPRMPSKAAPALRVVADLINTTPGITIPELARRLQAMGVQKPGGSDRWSKPTTEKFVEQARRLGMID